MLGPGSPLEPESSLTPNIQSCASLPACRLAPLYFVRHGPHLCAELRLCQLQPEISRSQLAVEKSQQSDPADGAVVWQRFLTAAGQEQGLVGFSRFLQVRISRICCFLQPATVSVGAFDLYRSLCNSTRYSNGGESGCLAALSQQDAQKYCNDRGTVYSFCSCDCSVADPC